MLIAGSDHRAVPAEGAVARPLADRWVTLVPAGHRHHLDGAVLAHTDLNPHNILITEHGARLVDWAWPTLGPAWVDTACAVLWLIAEGHSVAAAEHWAARVPAYRHADPEGITVVVDAYRLMWTRIADHDPTEWKRRARRAADAWAAHRPH